MKRFLYRFGYETPIQWKENERHGWDDEASSAFWIDGNSAEESLEWGREVSEALVQELFKRTGWKAEIPSWKEAGYAHWIEDPVGPEFMTVGASKLPVVTVGAMPEDLSWLVS